LYGGDDLLLKKSSRTAAIGLFLREENSPFRTISVGYWADLPGMLTTSGGMYFDRMGGIAEVFRIYNTSVIENTTLLNHCGQWAGASALVSGRAGRPTGLLKKSAVRGRILIPFQRSPEEIPKEPSFLVTGMAE
jgi:hypothetical protein